MVNASQKPGSYLIVTESLENMDSSVNEYYAAEAILHYAGTPVIRNQPKATQNLLTLSVQCDIQLSISVLSTLYKS